MTERPLRVFIDTNIWISAFINPTGEPARLLDAFKQDRFVPIASQALLAEIDDVLSRARIRRRLQFLNEDIDVTLGRLRDHAIMTSPTGLPCLCRDPRDDILLETAMLGNADYVVSRDDDIKRDLDLIAHLRANGVEVVSVAQFLRLLDDL